VVCKHSYGAGWDHTNRTQRVTPEKAFIVVDAVWGHYIGASAAYWTCRRGANVSQKPHTVAICRQQNARKSVAGKPAAGGENGYGLANMPKHTLYKMFDMVYHGIPPI